MSRALVYLGPATAVVNRLTRCEQLFLARWLQLLHDETHPHWSLRPLSLGNLRKLYPSTFDGRNKQFVFAIEDELLRRLAAPKPDIAGIAHPSQHSTHYGSRSQCIVCKQILRDSNATSLDRLAELVERLIANIEIDNERGVLALTPIVASEAVAANVPLRFMMQASRNYVLNPRGEKPGSFRDRLYDFLRHDVAQQPRDCSPQPSAKCNIQREVGLTLGGVPRTPVRMGNQEIGFLELQRDPTSNSRRLWVSRRDVEDRLSRRESVAAALRTQTPGWLAALRFCYPDGRIWAEPHIEITPTGKRIDCPGHRTIFSRREAAGALPALELLISNEAVRASLYWLSLAYQVWGESIAHASGMVWMSIESLISDGGIGACVAAYFDRLQLQLANDVAQTLGTLAGDAAAREKKGWPAPPWLTRLPDRRTVADDRAWLSEIVGIAATVSDDPSINFVLSDAASLQAADTRKLIQEQTVGDLQLLRAVRHAVAHTGKSIAEEPLLHYLATLGCECVRALLAQRLEGTIYEGILEGRPLLLSQCEVVKDHAHAFYIPAWVKNDPDTVYPSMFVESETGEAHRHELALKLEHREKLAAGKQVAIVSNLSAGHCHTIWLQNIRKPSSYRPQSSSPSSSNG